jgi:hypothetical protein
MDSGQGYILILIAGSEKAIIGYLPAKPAN